MKKQQKIEWPGAKSGETAKLCAKGGGARSGKAFKHFLIKLAWVAACAALLAFMAFAPAIIPGGLGKNVYTEREARQEQRYRGDISLWHVVSFQTGAKSGVSLLRERATAFERKNARVFVSVEAMDTREATARLAAGERPDVLSFPAGFPVSRAELVQTGSGAGLLPSYARCGEGYALAYMAQSYCLALPQESSVFGELTYDEFCRAAEGGLAAADYPGALPAAALACLRLPAGEGNAAGLPQTLASAQSFFSGESGVLLCSRADCDRAEGINAFFCSSYTDLVQLCAVFSGMEADKEQMCLELARSLLGKGFQKQLEDRAMLPTVECGAYETDAQMADEAKYLGESGIIPGAFALAENRDEIADAAQRVICGDESAWGDFMRSIRGN